jgi:hypothetical protein
MAEATIKIDGIDINIKSDIFSVKFMTLVKTIEKFQENYKQDGNNLCVQPPQQNPMVIDLSKRVPVSNSITQEEKIKRFNLLRQLPALEDDEPRDAIFTFDDLTLIHQVQKYLHICNQADIEQYYRDNKIKYRPFHLGGLYSKKYGIKTDKQRKIIRDLLRKCIQFTNSEYFKSRIIPKTSVFNEQVN